MICGKTWGGGREAKGGEECGRSGRAGRSEGSSFLEREGGGTMTERADALASARIGVAVLLGPKEAEKQGAGNEGWSADGGRAEWRGKVGMCSAVVCVRRGRVCWCVNLLTSLSIMGMAVGAGPSPWRASGPGSSQGERGARAGWMDVVGLVRAGAPVWTGRGWARPQRRAAFTWRPGPARMGASAKTAYGGWTGEGGWRSVGGEQQPGWKVLRCTRT